MREIIKSLWLISIGVWCTCCFICIFYGNSIPMWISLVVMNGLNVWDSHLKK